MVAFVVEGRWPEVKPVAVCAWEIKTIWNCRMITAQYGLRSLSVKSTTIIMSTPQSQWKTTYQGATVRGVEPEGEERPLWVFSTFLRESVMAYPQGTSEEEYREFMVELNRVWNVSLNHSRIPITLSNSVSRRPQKP